MKQRPIIIILILIVHSAYSYSGEIDWERVTVGVTANIQIPFGDFGKYWNNSAGFGGLAKYELVERIYLLGTLTVNYYSPASDSGERQLPHIWLVNLSAGIHYEIPLTPRYIGFLGIGGDNFTFIFRGRPAEHLGSNYIESEVALHGEAGISFRFERLPGISVFTRYSTIFSYPDQIPVWSGGVYVRF
jgi:hypothetical protein